MYILFHNIYSAILYDLLFAGPFLASWGPNARCCLGAPVLSNYDGGALKEAALVGECRQEHRCFFLLCSCYIPTLEEGYAHSIKVTGRHLYHCLRPLKHIKNSHLHVVTLHIHHTIKTLSLWVKKQRKLLSGINIYS